MSGGRATMTQSHSVHGGALSFMSCTSGRESSPLDENDSHQTGEFKTETKKKRFHPLRNLRRMFRRKTRHSNVSNDSYNVGTPENNEITTVPSLEQRSCSTSKLVEENGMQSLMKTNRLAPGLSLSHDSVFTPDRADSGLSSSDLENSSLSISNFVPPPMECPLKSHSSCSESSLLSMDSSEAELSPIAIKFDLDLGITSYKLSHSAAKHKMAVKPKRNHGAPRSKRRTMNSRSPLPSTPEVNEDLINGKVPSPDSPDFFMEIPESATSPMKSSSLVANLMYERSISDSKSPSAKSYDSELVSPKIIFSKSELKQDEVSKTGEEQIDLNEDDWGDDISTRKEESFFGRLLSRRSEKKKKCNVEKHVSEEHPVEDKYGKSSPVKESAKGTACNRSVNRRQRVEPIEIPSSPSLLKKNDFDSAGRNVRDNPNRMKVSYSMSPPKNVLPNPMISRSSSPPKVIWPDHYGYYKKEQPKDGSRVSLEKTNSRAQSELGKRDECRVSIQEDEIIKMRRDLSPIISKTKETQKIIADEMETKFKLMHSCSEDRTQEEASEEEPTVQETDSDAYELKTEEFPKIQSSKLVAEIDKSLTMREDEKSGEVRSNSVDSVDRTEVSENLLKSTASELFSSTDVVITHEEPHYVNLKNIIPVLNSYDKVHHGYENVQVIELVKKEEKKQEEGKSSENGGASLESEKKITKPFAKSLRKDDTPEFMKVQLNRVEPRSEDKPEITAGKPEPAKVRATLIERRKSELMLMNESDEKDWKGKVKLLKKQTSFSEKKLIPDLEKQETETPEDVGEVVMRKKANAGNGGDDQPELMKVFARRSLKVRESEEIAEEMRRSRDSDKENENADSPKEERKKVGKCDPDDRKQEAEKPKNQEEGVVLKPEAANRKSLFQKYGKSVVENGKSARQPEKLENGVSSAENKGKTRKEYSILEENKGNKMKDGKVDVTVSCIKEANVVVDEESEETGFKRIQQRKAEWERRVQQAAK